MLIQEVGNSNYDLLDLLLQGEELEQVPLQELRGAMEGQRYAKEADTGWKFGLISMSQKAAMGSTTTCKS